jgi:hypothetical protein
MHVIYINLRLESLYLLKIAYKSVGAFLNQHLTYRGMKAIWFKRHLG